MFAFSAVTVNDEYMKPICSDILTRQTGFCQLFNVYFNDMQINR